MQFIEPRPVGAYPLLVRLFFWNQKLSYGRVLDPARLWGLSPLVFMGVALLYGALNRKSSPLSPALRSLVTVRVSQLVHCAFCVDINTATLIRTGVSLEKVSELPTWRSSTCFSEDERLALEYAEAMTAAGGAGVNDALRNRLKSRWSDKEVVELTGMIAFQNMSARFNSALDVPSQGFCSVPPASQ